MWWPASFSPFKFTTWADGRSTLVSAKGKFFPRFVLGFYRRGSANRMILVRSGRETSTGYKHCYLGQRLLSCTVQDCTLSLIYLYWIYSMLVILPRLSVLSLRQGHVGGPLPSFSNSSTWPLSNRHSISLFVVAYCWTAEVCISLDFLWRRSIHLSPPTPPPLNVLWFHFYGTSVGKLDKSYYTFLKTSNSNTVINVQVIIKDDIKFSSL